MIHIFEPFSTQSPPSRLADVRMWFGSLPKSASVSPKHPITSPVAIFGSQRCFCSSVPNFQIGNMQSDPCDAHERAEARIPRLQLEACESVADGVRAQASVTLEVHAQEPERAELERHVLRERARLEPPVDAREDLLADPFAHQVAHLSLLLGKQVVDIQEIERVGSHHGPVA